MVEHILTVIQKAILHKDIADKCPLCGYDAWWGNREYAFDQDGNRILIRNQQDQQKSFWLANRIYHALREAGRLTEEANGETVPLVEDEPRQEGGLPRPDVAAAADEAADEG